LEKFGDGDAFAADEELAGGWWALSKAAKVDSD
jgi:hypothetical protein